MQLPDWLQPSSDKGAPDLHLETGIGILDTIVNFLIAFGAAIIVPIGNALVALLDSIFPKK